MDSLSARQRKIVGKIQGLANLEGFYILCRLMLDVDTSKPFDSDGFPTNVFLRTSTYEAVARMHGRGDREEHRRMYDAKLADVRSEMSAYFKMAKEDGLLRFSNLRLHYGFYAGKKYGRK